MNLHVHCHHGYDSLVNLFLKKKGKFSYKKKLIGKSDSVTFGNWQLLRFFYAVCLFRYRSRMTHRVCIWPQIQFFLHSNKILLRYSLCVECCLLLHFSYHSGKKRSYLLSCQKLIDTDQALSVQPLCASHFCGNNFRVIRLVAFLSNGKSRSQILLVKPLS